MEGQRDLHATIDTHYLPPPPYYIYYTSGIWHRGAGRRTARIGTSSVPTNLDGVRYGAELDLYAIRCGPGRRACLRIGTACVLRIGTTSDTVRARTASERSCRAMRLHAGLPLATGVRRAFKVSTLAFHAVDN